MNPVKNLAEEKAGFLKTPKVPPKICEIHPPKQRDLAHSFHLDYTVSIRTADAKILGLEAIVRDPSRQVFVVTGKAKSGLFNCLITGDQGRKGFVFTSSGRKVKNPFQAGPEIRDHRWPSHGLPL